MNLTDFFYSYKYKKNFIIEYPRIKKKNQKNVNKTLR